MYRRDTKLDVAQGPVAPETGMDGVCRLYPRKQHNGC